MITLGRTDVHCVPTGLCLYKVIAVSDMPAILLQGCIRLAGNGADQWKIGLRENVADAIEGEIKILGPVKKNSDVVLEIRFSALGVAHYTTLCQGPDYDFRSTLQKMVWPGCRRMVWHFHADLPLQAYDEQGNVLVTTRFMEIV